MANRLIRHILGHCPPENCLPGLLGTLSTWCHCNSGTWNLEGLGSMASLLEKDIRPLADDVEMLPAEPLRETDPFTGKTSERPLGHVLRAFKRRDSAPVRILLNGHMDTVFPAGSSFRECVHSPDGTRLNGPGVADMKGGLIVLLKALEILEAHPSAKNIAWEILVNADEETGSPGSDRYLRQSAARNNFGLTYESSPPGGSLVRSRMGNGNFLLRAAGCSVHVGKNFSCGRNAIEALAEFITGFRKLNSTFPEARFNTGLISGGGSSNTVPAHAHARFGIRIRDKEQPPGILAAIGKLRADIEARHKVRLLWDGCFNNPPKTPDPPTISLYHAIRDTGKNLGQNLPWHDTGGSSDGAKLLAYGLPNIDSLGVIGSNLHSPEEYMETASLPARIHLSALLLLRLATGEISPPAPSLP